MKRFVLVQGNQIALYLDGKKFGVWEWAVAENENASEIIEYIRIYGDKL